MADSCLNKLKSCYSLQQLRDNKGLTLVEILITLALTTFALLALFKLSITTHSSNDFVQEKNEALSVARTVLEKISTFRSLEEFHQIRSEEKVTKKYHIRWEVHSLEDSLIKKIKLKLESENQIIIELEKIIFYQNPIVSAAITHTIHYNKNLADYRQPMRNNSINNFPAKNIDDLKIKIIKEEKLNPDIRSLIDASNNFYLINQTGKILFYQKNIDLYPIKQIKGRFIFNKKNFNNNYRIIANNHAYCLINQKREAQKTKNFQCFLPTTWWGKITIIAEDVQICPDNTKQYIGYQSINHQLKLTGIKKQYDDERFYLGTKFCHQDTQIFNHMEVDPELNTIQGKINSEKTISDLYSKQIFCKKINHENQYQCVFNEKTDLDSAYLNIITSDCETVLPLKKIQHQAQINLEEYTLFCQ